MRSRSPICNRFSSRLVFASLIFSAIVFPASCQKKPEASSSLPVSSPSPVVTPTPTQQTKPVEVRHYQGSGVVTKVVRENPYDKSLASVELNHGEIVGLMPPMRMEFYVKTVTLLDGINVGDVVDFTIEEKGGTEIISELKKK